MSAVTPVIDLAGQLAPVNADLTQLLADLANVDSDVAANLAAIANVDSDVAAKNTAALLRSAHVTANTNGSGIATFNLGQTFNIARSIVNVSAGSGTFPRWVKSWYWGSGSVIYAQIDPTANAYPCRITVVEFRQ